MSQISITKDPHKHPDEYDLSKNWIKLADMPIVCQKCGTEIIKLGEYMKNLQNTHMVLDKNEEPESLHLPYETHRHLVCPNCGWETIVQIALAQDVKTWLSKDNEEYTLLTFDPDKAEKVDSWEELDREIEKVIKGDN